MKQTSHPKVVGSGIGVELVLEQIEQTDGFEPTLTEDGEITVVPQDR